MSPGNIDLIRVAISYIPPHDRDLWVRMAMAVKVDLGEDGFSIWDTWSQGSDSYVAKDALAVWKSCKANGAVSGGSLFHEAKQHGWIDDEKTPRAARKARAANGEAPKDDAQAKAARMADSKWQRAKPVPRDHAYLLEKQIQPHGVRAHRGDLFVPMYHGPKLCSLQIIKANEAGADEKFSKKFLPGGRASGCSYLIGEPGVVLCVAEGFATGASIREATGYAVTVAFSAGNLLSVAKTMRRQFPDLKIILCADDDHRTEGNPGIERATQAARAIGGLLAIPSFGVNRPDVATDFNDLAQHSGPDAVRRAIADARKPDASQTSEPSSASPDTFPSTEQRPCFRVFDDVLKTESGNYYRAGVWFFGTKQGKANDPPTLIDRWIASPVHIDAVTFDGTHNNFGRLLRFKNTLGRYREWAMPMDLLRAAGDELRGELLGMGVHIDPNAHRLLGQYLQALTPDRRMHCAVQVGWCGDSFVLPDTVIGPSAADVIFQSGERGQEEYTKGGTAEGWKTEIAARAVGNPLLLLTLSASFAGPLLHKCNAEGGGFHFVGQSSTGKTAALSAACSIWGGPSYLRGWKATANGLEGAAVLFNDCLLALDEINEGDPREIGLIVYALANGRGKQRASRTGSARRVARWTCMVLSSGETSIETAMGAGGFRTKAGQEVRLLNTPSAGEHGAWDNLHGFSNGAKFSDAIKQAAVKHHGHVGRAFLERLTRDPRDFSALLDTTKVLPEFAAEGGGGQDRRAAGRFAMVAMAGELATEYSLTGWPKGAATKAAADGFKAWQGERGPGNDEPKKIVEAVTEFIQRHGDSRFSDAQAIEETVTRDRAGWWKNTYDGRVYLFNASALREALKGYDFKRALDVLQDAKILAAPTRKGERAEPTRIGKRVVKLYSIQIEKSTDSDNET